ncbi:hypothetical protein DFA_07291 [Cavenderia fasciculata]|uniref:Endonuclease/exonuclease/phosphatase domain-containing protein n=1 Tax=Cavenderia fasciculata TaxID=261658 RepID=F4PW07_CACFS|nr:uncharacterized protein DFA_07291 [Cavenderia fasciculata]EGG20171.1 hypothetical protein DFA_07291 [Cavenderia fasciculata]|eukprot:XP_004367154.1 hypothetical protein DFA_07291 [Cavenderia fasciculata]
MKKINNNVISSSSSSSSYIVVVMFQRSLKKLITTSANRTKQLEFTSSSSSSLSYTTRKFGSSSSSSFSPFSSSNIMMMDFKEEGEITTMGNDSSSYSSSSSSPSLSTLMVNSTTTATTTTTQQTRERFLNTTIDRDGSGNKTVNNPNNNTIRITTFNILAPCYVRDNSKYDGQFGNDPMRRQEQITQMLKQIDTDIINLQEFFFGPTFQTFYEAQLGDTYNPIYLQRTNHKKDGLAVFIKKTLRIKNRKYIKFNDQGDRVALLLHIISPNVMNENI